MLAARKTYLITARARKNKRAARVLASARKDHSIPLHVIRFPPIEKGIWVGRQSPFLTAHACLTKRGSEALNLVPRASFPMCSIYEMIHICTAGEDEIKE